MKKLLYAVFVCVLFFTLATPVLAAAPSEITNYTNDTLHLLTLIAISATVFFLVKGGYGYITSSGQPEALEDAKKTIRRSLIGLVVVLAAGVIVSVGTNALSAPSGSGDTGSLPFSPIIPVKPADGLTQVLLDAVNGFLQNIVESATKPIVDSIISFLATTPDLLTNSVVFNFWLTILGIVDSLFVVLVAVLGLHFMSASTFGFEEVELKQLLPRIGLNFLGANISLFLANYVIITSNALVTGVISATGGLNHAWITNAVTLEGITGGTTPIITLIFLIIFLIISIVLLLMYITRLIMISLGAVLSPFIFLLFAIPKFSDIAEGATKTYLVTVFMIFVHVVIIQLAASFLALPDHPDTNSLLSIALAIGLFITLLKVPGLMMQLAMYTSKSGTFKKLGAQIINVLSTDSQSSDSRTDAKAGSKLKRKVVYA